MPKALIIDDEAALTTIVRRFLERSGFRVEAATSGPEGLQKAIDERPDVIIVDVMMPDMDGYEVCRRLRSDPRTARTTVLVLTARGQSVDREMALQAGADAHAAKPFNGKALVRQIEELLIDNPFPDPPLGFQTVILRLKDGVGATTTATNLALCLAEEKGRLAAIADLVLPDGQVGRRLGLTTSSSWLEASDLDADRLIDHLAYHDAGLFALPVTTPRHPRRVDSARISQLLVRLRAWHDYVVVDTARDLGALAPVLLRSSALVLLLLAPDPATLRTAQASLAAIHKLGARSLRIWPVLTKVDAGHHAFRGQVEEVLGLPVVAALPWAPDECAGAVAQQRPVLLSYPQSALAAAFRDLGTKVSRAATAQPGRRGLS